MVESPTKAKTIQKYLGSGWVVKATLGHIKDLPEEGLGVDEETLKPKFVWVKGKKKLVEELKRLSAKAQEVYIGTDPDREGEAIAYFVYKELYPVNPKLYRVVFYEITPESIKSAIKNAGSINMNLVYAQFARRILDRLIGYRLSPYLWKEFNNRRLSVGRVQSPALRLIVEREREIENFKKKEYYYIKLVFEKDGVEFSALWEYRFEKPSNAEPFIKKLSEAFFEVAKIERKRELKEPPKPFITASLQATANQVLKLSVDEVQKIAQRLYEEGYITYPRTDSHRMNENKAQEFIAYIRENYGEQYAGRLRRFKTKETTQGAHECIRPTSLKKPPLQGKELALYELILARTLASLSTPAEFLNTRILIKPICPQKGCEGIVFVAKGRELTFEGYLRFYPENVELARLPQLKEGEVLKPKKVTLEKRQTQPPPRYTEGTLVKKLEELGIGRPSTYATIVKTLKSRGYVVEEKAYLKPTEIAYMVVDYLLEHVPKVPDYRFTSYMERELDLVEEGKEDWKTTVRKLFQEVLKDGRAFEQV
ncbi:MAG: type I DNA topoisomerase [Aquificota bacterium]|nr:MAG: type I DNA topoisomerase [Aquificota bacterium]